VWENLNSSLWFLPGLMVIGALLLFIVTYRLDTVVQSRLSYLPVVYSGGPAAARSVLSTIAGSVVTVVATVFSLTVVTLQLASGQYSLRLLRTFTANRGVQVVLGAYVATFLYSLLVLRVVRNPEGETVSFNPVISTTTAIVLALACVGLLVYFFQHVADIIQSSTIVRSAERDAKAAIAKLKDLAETSAKEKTLFRRPAGEPLLEISSQESGYLQHLDVEAIERALGSGVAEGETVIAEVPFGPGRYINEGLPLARICAPHEYHPRVEREVRTAFFIGKERSFRQDFVFDLRQLADVALKGLSPAMNDPTTAMQAIDRIKSIFIALESKALPERVRRRRVAGTTVLAWVDFYAFEDAVGTAFDQLRRTALTAGQVALLERLLEALERAIWANKLPNRRRTLWVRTLAVARLAPEQVPDPRDESGLPGDTDR
jgi:uncharacterized membrane protein